MGPTPSKSFLRELHAFDPDLRLTWWKHTHQWAIEIVCKPRQPAYLKEKPNPLGQSARAKDLWNSWKDGYLHVLSVPYDLLEWSIVGPYLERYRVESHEDAARLADTLDALDEAWEASIDRQTDTLAEAAAHDLYDTGAWAQKRRVSTYVPDRAEVTHEGFIVRDRRVGAG